MKWARASLGDVAPAERAEREFAPNEVVWHLNLDHIESQTGRILAKQRAPVSSAGNSTFLFDERNVLYSKLRPYLNKVVHPDELGIGTTELVPLRPRPGVLEADFLKFYLRSDRFVGFANSVVAGAKMPRMIMDKFWEHVIPLPAPTEQRRIVELLEQADGLRRKHAEADALADRILPALFHKLFGDPATNPKGWSKLKLGDVIVEASYGTSIPSNTSGEGLPVLRMNNIKSNGRLNLAELKYVTLDEAEAEKHLLRDGDLLFNRTNSKELVGKTGLWRVGFPAVAASYLIRVRVDISQAVPDYIWAWMNTPYFKQRLFDISRRAVGMANINATELRAMPLLVPAMALQHAFAARLRSLDGLATRRAEAAQQLQKLFSTLLHRAFAGDLTAKWREAHMGELAAEMEHQARLLKSPTEE